MEDNSIILFFAVCFMFLIILGVPILLIIGNYTQKEACEDEGYEFVWGKEAKRCYDEYENEYYPIVNKGFFKYKVLDGGR